MPRLQLKHFFYNILIKVHHHNMSYHQIRPPYLSSVLLQQILYGLTYFFLILIQAEF